MQRLSKDEYGCLMALSASTRSEGRTTHVGCIIADNDGRIIATGFNGYAPGSNLDIAEPDNKKSRPYYIHAETNALALIEKGRGHTLYCTHSPCASCAQNIAAHKIKQVIYIDLHESSRDEVSFKQIFKAYNIKYRQINTLEKTNIRRCITQKIT